MNANIIRGQKAFTDYIDATLGSLDKDSQTRLLQLKNIFESKVGVMPENGLYAATRMAKACVEAITVHGLTDESAVLEIYNSKGKPTSGITSRISNNAEVGNRGQCRTGIDSGDLAHDNETAKLQDEIVHAYTTEIHLEEGADHIDLLEDAAKLGELSVEGMRAMGIVDVTFNPSKDTLTSEIITSANQLIQESEENWTKDENGFLTILCPGCKSDKIYPYGNDKFGCLMCDLEFEFRVNLSDLN